MAPTARGGGGRERVHRVRCRSARGRRRQGSTGRRELIRWRGWRRGAGSLFGRMRAIIRRRGRRRSDRRLIRRARRRQGDAQVRQEHCHEAIRRPPAGRTASNCR
eukprot:14874815-Alexandrium_andersonii.AAC.1